MTRPQLLAMLLFAYAALVTVIAAWAHRRTHHLHDFVVGNRRGANFIVGLSQALNLLPVWLMLLVSAGAFVWGLAAVWIALALWFGGLIQAFYIAPRARTLSAGQHSFTLTQLLSCEAGERLQKHIARSASFLIALTTIVMVLIQLQLISAIMAPTLATGAMGLTAIGLFLILVGTAGWWAHAAMEAVHALLMLCIVAVTALLAYGIVGGWHEFVVGVQALDSQFLEWDAGRKNVVAVALIGGSLGLAGLAVGQPALVNRALAARDERTARLSGVVLMVWLTLTLLCLLAVGWLGRVVYFGLQQPEFALFEISRRSLHPAMSAGIALIAAGAVLTNVVAQLGTLSMLLVSDLRPGRAPLHNEWSRVAIVVLVIVVLVLLQYARTFGFADLSFCWTALGATLGPLLLVRLTGKRVRGGSTVGAMSAGFVLVCLFHAMPDAPGDFLERVLPFVAGLGIALSGGERRRNPDRADRSEETVHDRLPI